MAVEYLCKVCRGHLKVKTSIVLAASKTNSPSQGIDFFKSRDRELHNHNSSFFPDQGR